MGWANRITIGRGICTLAVWALVVWGTNAPSEALWWTAFALFTLAAATDFVDGMVARKLGEVSVFGRIVDPLVDKLLTIGAMVLLLGVEAARDVLPAWAVALMLGRELLVTTLRSAAESKGVNFQAVVIGKYKMVAQCIAVGAVFAYVLRWPFVIAELGAGWNLASLLVQFATLLTVYSGYAYVRRAVTALRGA
jgi:CDP-diacylglycerol--glycerol-3-phosphate 3-phosphatidyltransferase